MLGYAQTKGLYYSLRIFSPCSRGILPCKRWLPVKRRASFIRGAGASFRSLVFTIWGESLPCRPLSKQECTRNKVRKQEGGWHPLRFHQGRNTPTHISVVVMLRSGAGQGPFSSRIFFGQSDTLCGHQPEIERM